MWSLARSIDGSAGSDVGVRATCWALETEEFKAEDASDSDEAELSSLQPSSDEGAAEVVLMLSDVLSAAGCCQSGARV